MRRACRKATEALPSTGNILQGGLRGARSHCIAYSWQALGMCLQANRAAGQQNAFENTLSLVAIPAYEP
jgi:hypothetical protein